MQYLHHFLIKNIDNNYCAVILLSIIENKLLVVIQYQLVANNLFDVLYYTTLCMYLFMSFYKPPFIIIYQIVITVKGSILYIL